MAVDKTKITGRRGENKAAKFLKKNGWKILERNFVSPFGEVDIIAKKGDVIAFVEVKTTLTDLYGTPSDKVTSNKIRRYKLGADYYFTESDVNCTVRFDIIEVYKKAINHIENAF